MRTKYSSDFKDRAVRMVLDGLEARAGLAPWTVVCDIAPKLGVAPQSLQPWYRQYQIDAGVQQGLTSVEREEMKRLKRENAELRRANEILKTASAFFAAELDRPAR